MPSPVTFGVAVTARETEVIRLVNVERDRAGCGPVRLNTKLRTAIRLQGCGANFSDVLEQLRQKNRQLVRLTVA